MRIYSLVIATLICTFSTVPPVLGFVNCGDHTAATCSKCVEDANIGSASELGSGSGSELGSGSGIELGSGSGEDFLGSGSLGCQGGGDCRWTEEKKCVPILLVDTHESKNASNHNNSLDTPKITNASSHNNSLDTPKITNASTDNNSKDTPNITNASTDNKPSAPSSSEDPLGVGAIVGISIGSVVFIILVIYISCKCCRKIRPALSYAVSVQARWLEEDANV